MWCKRVWRYGFESNALEFWRWRKQQILELEVYSKRLELVQEQIRSALQELRAFAAEEAGNMV
uniref:Uncharacterized protein n=1 Tax=Vitis vinifera TaxID=29760 RepID=F6HTU4_VITVI